MDLEFTAEERAFRAEVRAFLQEHVPRATRDKVLAGRELGREDYLEWQRRLHERGWGGVNWPLQFGGTGWNAVQQFIFEEESALAGAPRLIPFGLKSSADSCRRSARPRPGGVRDIPSPGPVRISPRSARARSARAISTS
jgi:alkylation response protein AidB-like acyl-CoA dehydrogenase